MSDLDIQSPCIGVCSMDDLTGLCQGCYRTLEEIQQWWDLDSNQKKQVIHQVAEREAQLFD
ncbi:MAG: DUF1289 domain-containing protein [Methylotenera sp.]|nr:MAG: DUF1289 domain-containing protein [Methylotenera sp.]